MIRNIYFTSEELTAWLSWHLITRKQIAEALGIRRTAIDNWISRGVIPQRAQVLIHHFMKTVEEEPGQKMLTSYITIPLENKIINDAIKGAMNQGMSLENFLAQIVKDNLSS